LIGCFCDAPDCFLLVGAHAATRSGDHGKAVGKFNRLRTVMELWLVDLEGSARGLEELERETPRLGVDERSRAQRLRDPAERRHRLAAYTALRIVLERVGGPRLRGRPLIRTAAGKPGLGAEAPTFSLAHTGGMALIGVARAGPFGVDLETERPIAMSHRRREETIAVGSGLTGHTPGDAGNHRAVLQAWCRIEACAKARGSGVSGLLTELGLRQSGGRRLPLAGIETSARQLAREAGLKIGDLELPLGLFGAVAGTGRALPVRPRRFPAHARAISRLLGARG
jgi:4'-phosphopantetheinyl transferase